MGRASFEIAPEFIVSLLRPLQHPVIFYNAGNQLPEDMKIVGLRMDVDKQMINILMDSEEFEDGDIISASIIADPFSRTELFRNATGSQQ